VSKGAALAKLPAVAFPPEYLLPWPHLTRLACDVVVSHDQPMYDVSEDHFAGDALALQLLAASPCAAQLLDLEMQPLVRSVWGTCPVDVAAAFPRLQKLPFDCGHGHNVVDDSASIAQLTTLTSLTVNHCDFSARSAAQFQVGIGLCRQSCGLR